MSSQSDTVAAKLGDLLLKGYRMLDASCPFCNTVLMQDRNEQKLCVLCGSEKDQLKRAQQQQQEQLSAETNSRAFPEGKFISLSSKKGTLTAHQPLREIQVQHQQQKRKCWRLPLRHPSSPVTPPRKMKKYAMDEDVTEVKAAGLRAESVIKIQAAINDIASEVKSTAEDLSGLRDYDRNFLEREKLLKHIKLCTEVMKDLRDLSRD